MDLSDGPSFLLLSTMDRSSYRKQGESTKREPSVRWSIEKGPEASR
jgi:hypothetical protein